MARKGDQRRNRTANAPTVNGGTLGSITGFNTTRTLAALKRRSLIAEALLIYDLTQREIAELLEEQGSVNPKTGEAWSIGTINRDCQKMRDDWEAEAARKYGEHMEDQLSRIKLAQRTAWTQGDLDAYARFMDQEIKITGTGLTEARNPNDETLGDAWEVFDVLNGIADRLDERRKLTGSQGSQTIDGEVI